MNRAIDAASAQQGGVRGVHDGFGCLFRDVGGSVEVENPSPVKRYPKSKVRHAVFLRYFLSVRASTPGKVLPSRNSKDAPPPVEMCVILSATPAARTADTESPPPTIDSAPGLSATARATLNVPR